MNFYKEELLDHYNSPRNRGTIDAPDFKSGQVNPSCGDSIEIAGIIKDNAIEKIVFTGAGCVISQATASMVTEYALGKTPQAMANFTQEQLLSLIGIELGPMRLKCATLTLVALHQGLAAYAAKQEKDA